MQTNNKSSPVEIGIDKPRIERLAREIVQANIYFHSRADQFEFSWRGDVFVVRGNVPSFYLKQVLQSALQTLGGGCRIDNQVSVVPGIGFSSSELKVPQISRPD